MNPANPNSYLRFCVDGFSISHAQWADESNVVIYHHASGDTHLVTGGGFKILEYIKDKPHTLQEIHHLLIERAVSEKEIIDLDDLEQRYLIPFYKLGLIKYFVE